MSLLARLRNLLIPAGRREEITSESLESSLGLDLTRLPPAPDISYNVMRPDGARAGILLLSESGRGLPFLGTWVEDAGGLWRTEAELARLAETAPLRIEDRAVFADLRWDPPVVLAHLSTHQTQYRPIVMRRNGVLGRHDDKLVARLDPATFFLRPDWIQAIVPPPPPGTEPGSYTAIMASTSGGETKVLILDECWGVGFRSSLAALARGGKPVTPWEEANRMWRIHCPESLQRGVTDWGRNGIPLPEEAGGAEALAQWTGLLEFGLARGAQFHWTTF